MARQAENCSAGRPDAIDEQERRRAQRSRRGAVVDEERLPLRGVGAVLERGDERSGESRGLRPSLRRRLRPRRGRRARLAAGRAPTATPGPSPVRSCPFARARARRPLVRARRCRRCSCRRSRRCRSGRSDSSARAATRRIGRSARLRRAQGRGPSLAARTGAAAAGGSGRRRPRARAGTGRRARTGCRRWQRRG